CCDPLALPLAEPLAVPLPVPLLLVEPSSLPLTTRNTAMPAPTTTSATRRKIKPALLLFLGSATDDESANGEYGGGVGWGMPDGGIMFGCDPGGIIMPPGVAAGCTPVGGMPGT